MSEKDMYGVCADPLGLVWLRRICCDVHHPSHAEDRPTTHLFIMRSSLRAALSVPRRQSVRPSTASSFLEIRRR